MQSMVAPIKLYPGLRYGKLTVVKRVKGNVWYVKCDCGENLVMPDYLWGLYSSCGCDNRYGMDLRVRKEQKRLPINLTGKKFGKLTVLKRNGTVYKWLCVCDCGNKVTVKRTDLCSGDVRSCGRCEE